MIAEYTLTKEDLCTFSFYHHFHSAAAQSHYRRAWFTPAFVWLLVCTSIWYLADKDRGTPLRTLLDLLPLFSGVPIHLAIFPWWYRHKLRKIMRGMIAEGQNRGLFSPHRLTMSPECITDSSEHGQTSTGWRAVERVATTDDYAYIYISALTAIIVPRRAFTGSSEFEEFIRGAREHHKKATA